MKAQLIKKIMGRAKITNISCLENLNIIQLTFLLDELNYYERLTDEA